MIAFYIFIYKTYYFGNGSIQTRIRKRKWNFFCSLYSTLAQKWQIRGHQMHEKEIRLVIKSKKA